MLSNTILFSNTKIKNVDIVQIIDIINIFKNGTCLNPKGYNKEMIAQIIIVSCVL